MQIGFFNVWRGDPTHTVLADLMIRSTRKAMPHVPIVQFTDEDTPALYGVDEVRRRTHPQTAMLRIEHHIACEDDWLFLDTDVVVQKDVQSVFDEPFDIAIADRDGC